MARLDLVAVVSRGCRAGVGVRAHQHSDAGSAEAGAPLLRLNASVAQDLDFDEDDLQAPAGPRTFDRRRGRDGWTTATVHGTDAYQAELILDGPNGLAGECDCPYGMEGNFCKHLVALDRYGSLTSTA
ncbi:hypothetical protein BIV25_19225 [Streptomyces sp. MUSC 14]|nr:hypothetical protein BIV25_19225 [Streptomyces sp. MUSC 14]